MNKPTHRIRRCKGNTFAWCLVALDNNGDEIKSHGGFTTALTLDDLLRYAGGLLPGQGDLVEILYYPAD